MTSLSVDAVMRIHNFSGNKMSFLKILLQKIFVAGGSKIRAQDVLYSSKSTIKGDIPPVPHTNLRWCVLDAPRRCLPPDSSRSWFQDEMWFVDTADRSRVLVTSFVAGAGWRVVSVGDRTCNLTALDEE